ncbi:enhanced serine sensitivity protein SseB C-terminal domain-containing protein [Streptomyces spiramenti]|uniref:Enhanced serine sensitivity protein SseB n=1 Tax=Streptomyces spiramenti TaxID=2720606 RepID=A0ABX1AS60_9ACTN|nr:enhanced serine sensitivity protein SseB C-terminal domain-containing protein [Streptomyces spiramenti]NJP67137.1 enhanced serine sensitivity protein SseB [Streptomyces spiramenti]
MNAGPTVAELRSRVTGPDRLAAYEELLGALSRRDVHMPLWDGAPDDEDARFGLTEVDGHAYAPGFTSEERLAAAGWGRAHLVLPSRDVAAALYRERCGLWLDAHEPDGGMGVPWLDLRRVAEGLDRLPAGPLHLAEPAAPLPDFYRRLTAEASRVPGLRRLWRAWVRPAIGEPHLAVGVELDESAAHAAPSVPPMLRRALPLLPPGVTVAGVDMGDPYDPVALWLRSASLPFYDRDASRPAAP